MLKLGYLGPEGTFSHEAAEIASATRYKLVPFRPISSVLEAFRNCEVQRAIVPLENLIEGEVSQTVDHLISNGNSQNLQITGELLLAIRQTLVAKPGTRLEDIKRITSHIQGLGQCRRFLSQYNWEEIEVASTAQAAKMVAESSDKDLAAIASGKAAELYHLEVISSDIGDSIKNITRFIILGGPAPRPTGEDRTTIFFVTRNQTGALFQALGVFFYQGINLTKITSRTAKTEMGEYVFWIDADGHRDDPAIRIAIKQLQERFTQKIWVAGSYPKAK
ncbi:MAG: hypothetical protein A2731_00385 [Candidatus Buchananbacteria bacterium RIFCSPHIGHO2_01_FULL_39_8]|uniref:prephenate dehydratase n=1 Tax=Candidatus Buchananbacteria bacterium RIFCSPHIGHO2_01_FULL_39_8 TaxID=1797533 RepID=A0A1G1XY74_9BACT|nr:MAG: hypothetical protein A2731_00385 [Candidatus Buchananbacteria bacterium RIFCSPHIGHO2_01_FULL_39_8]